MVQQALHLPALAGLADLGGDDLCAALRAGRAAVEAPLDQAVDDDVDTGGPVGHGLEPGTRVVLTAGRRTGTPGATNLVMVRNIP